MYPGCPGYVSGELLATGTVFNVCTYAHMIRLPTSSVTFKITLLSNATDTDSYSIMMY